MQDYLMPNDVENMNKEEAQMIFKIRCRSLNVKMNMKNQYDSFECLVCLSENETQDHIYECKEILKLKNFKHSEIPKYQEIFMEMCTRKYQQQEYFKKIQKYVI